MAKCVPCPFASKFVSEGATTYHELRKRSSWSSILNAIAPFWDGNETWLVLIGAGLFAAFPMVYAISCRLFICRLR